MLKQLMNSFPGYLFCKDQDSNYLTCNKQFSMFVGRSTPDAIRAMDDYQLFSRAHADAYRKVDRAIQNAREIITAEPIITSQGKAITILCKKTPLLNLNNNIEGVIGTFKVLSNHLLTEKSVELKNSVYSPTKAAKNSNYQPTEALTKREFQCMIYRVLGYSAKQVADVLNVSNRTAESYIDKIHSKTGCRTKDMLQNYVLETDILDLVF